MSSEQNNLPSPWSASPELWDKLKPLASQLRSAPTPAENHLWKFIRKQSLGVKFRRQHVFDRFIVDFYCHETRLVIEVDGGIHEYTQEEDAVRQEFLESLGLRVIRFTNGEVLQQTNVVLDRMAKVIFEQRSSTPP